MPSNTISVIWVRLFKTNDVVSECFVKFSECFVKFSEVNFSNMPTVFVENVWEAFAVQKLLSVFQQNISVYLVIKS